MDGTDGYCVAAFKTQDANFLFIMAKVAQYVLDVNRKFDF